MTSKAAIAIFCVLFHATTTMDIPETTVDFRLTGTTMRSIPRGAVKDRPLLRSLNFDGDGVEDVAPGAFVNVSNLFEIHLSRNLLESIVVGVFNELNLRSVYLDRNRIKTIEREAFDNMTHLAFVQLEGNLLETIDCDWFTNTRIYAVIYNGNNIRTVPARCFKNFKTNSEVSIYLMGNGLEALHESAFDGLTKLGDVYLSNNSLTVLNGSFASLEYARNVHLDYNRLTCLSEDFKMTKVLESVNIEGNPMSCECLTDLQYWSGIYNFTLVVDENKFYLCSINLFSGD